MKCLNVFGQVFFGQVQKTFLLRKLVVFLVKRKKFFLWVKNQFFWVGPKKHPWRNTTFSKVGG